MLQPSALRSTRRCRRAESLCRPLPASQGFSPSSGGKGTRRRFPLPRAARQELQGLRRRSGPAQQVNSSQTQCVGGLRTSARGEAVWEGQPGVPRWLCPGACCQAGTAERIRYRRLLRRRRGAHHRRRQHPVPLPAEAAGPQSCGGLSCLHLLGRSRGSRAFPWPKRVLFFGHSIPVSASSCARGPRSDWCDCGFDPRGGV